MSYLCKLANDISSPSSHLKATRKVHLVWMVRSLSKFPPPPNTVLTISSHLPCLTLLPGHLTWIQPWMTELFAHDFLNHLTHAGATGPHKGLGTMLSISIHVTGHKDDPEDYMPGPTPKWIENAPRHIPLVIDHERPDMRALLEREQAEQIGALAVSVCGPGSLGDSVRDAVRHVQGEKIVDLYEETFSW